jgi:hypothetical protein
MKGWLDKYNDGGPIQPNYNDYSVSAGPGFQGDGYSNVGRNYSPAWGGQFQDGGKLSFINNPKLRNMLEGYKPGFLETVGDYRLPGGQIIPLRDPSSEVSISVGGGDGEPAYLIPSFKYGQPLQDPVQEFNMTEQYLGGPFKTVNDAETFRELRHQYVGKGQPLPSPIATSNMAMGGSIGGATQGIPGATGFMYARTGTTPSEDKGRNKIYKTDASAQNGKEIPKVTGTKFLPPEIKPEEEVTRPEPEPEKIIPYTRPSDPDPISSAPVDPGRPVDEELYIPPKVAEKVLKQLDPNSYDPFVFYDLYDNNRVKINNEDIERVKSDMINYLNSPLYRQRLNNYPENYNGNISSYEKKKFENTIANKKTKERIKQLRDLPYMIREGKHAGNSFDPMFNHLFLRPTNNISTIAHELGHSIITPSPLPRIIPKTWGEATPFTYIDSDNINSKYQDSSRPHIKFNPFSINLNEKETKELINRAKPLIKDSTFEGDSHYDKNYTDHRNAFAQESYGDLMGAREILYKKGYTKNFGDPIDKKLLNKAMKDKDISNDFIFRRFYEKYGPENIIQLNNTIASNDVKQGVPMAQKGTKIEEDKAPISLIGKDFEKWIRNAGDDGISTYFSDLYNKRKASGEKITEEDYKGVKQQMLEYINSPLYAERQANLPDDYGLSKEARKSPDAEKFLKKFNQETYDWKKKKRIELLNEVGIKLDEPKERTGHYLPSQLPSNIELSTPYTRSVIAHELGHAMHDFKVPLTDEQKAYMKENKGELPRDKQLGYRPAASDSTNAQNFYKYAKEEKGSGAQFANPKLNKAEANMFQRLAKPISLTSDKTRYREEDSSNFISNSSSQMETRAFNKRVDEYKRKMQQHYAKDEHIDKDSSDKFEFADEMYGDMQGVRQLLLDSGITKSFGEELDEEKINKAILDKNVTDDPAFRRFYFRYGKDNIIKLNNTIAANNPQQGMPIAQNGMEMSYYQNGLDFKPKSISKNGSVIKDDMGQWAHPGEITEIGSNQITMQGVPYPVLGISDTGDTQMMYPEQEYEFIGDSVTEYPMMQNGGWLDSLVDAGKSAVNYVGSFFEDPAPAPVVKPKVVPVKPKLDTYDTILDLGFNNPQRRKLQQQLEKGFDYSEDKNKIKLATGRFTGANVSSKLIDDLAAAAKRNNIPIGQLLTLAGRESTFGEEKGNSRHGFGSESYVSGWNVAEDYKTYDPLRFLADKKVPGVKVEKGPHGYKYAVPNEKITRDYLKKNPQILEQYKKKVAETPDIGNKNYFDLTAEFLKKKGVKGYNPGDPRYVQMFNQDYDTLKQDKQLMSYLTKKGYKYEQGGQLTKLDQLTNFTNYNTKQPGGWLDKYQ